MRRALAVAGLLAALLPGCSAESRPKTLPAPGPGELVTALVPGEDGLRADAAFSAVAVGPDRTLYVLTSRSEIERNNVDDKQRTPVLPLLAFAPGKRGQVVDEFHASSVSYWSGLPPAVPFGLAAGEKGLVFVADPTDSSIDVYNPAREKKREGLSNDTAPPGDDADPIERAVNKSRRAPLDGTVHLAFDQPRNLLYAASRVKVVKLPADGVPRTIAGTGKEPPRQAVKSKPYLGDYKNADLGPIGGLTFDPRSGDVYYADWDRIWKADASGVITSFAGSDAIGFEGDGGPAASAFLSGVEGLAFDAASGSLYVADRNNCRVRRIDAAGIITTVAGGGCEAKAGERGRATDVLISSPQQLAVDGAGHLYITNVFPPRLYVVGV